MIGAESHERYTTTDLQLAEEIADRAALAIDTARLFAAETAARARALEEVRRNEVLTNATAAFGRATTTDEVIAAMLEEGIRAAGAGAATVGILDDDRHVSLRGLSGYQPDDRPYWHEFDLHDQVPMSEAINERRAVVVSTTADRDRRYPSLVGTGEQRDHALVCVPLLLGGDVLGAFSASYPPETDFGEDDLRLLGSIGEQCAQAIDRARAREGELAARSRLDALAAASQALANSLAFDETIATIMRLAAQHFGDDVSLIRFGDHGIEVLAESRRRGGVGSRAARRRARPRAALRSTPLLEEYSTHRASPGDRRGGRRRARRGAARTRMWRRISGSPSKWPAGWPARSRTRGCIRSATTWRRSCSKGSCRRRCRMCPRSRSRRCSCRPSCGHQICGDFYDVFEITEGRWAAVVGDVCGKGVEAATLTGMARHTLRAVTDTEQPSEALEVLNKRVAARIARRSVPHGGAVVHRARRRGRPRHDRLGRATRCPSC